MKVINICVAGAGTMGSGIALCAAQNGFKVILFDLNSQVMEKAISSIEKNLITLLEKNKITAEEKQTIFNSITFTSDIQDCKASLIIEAIVEKMAAKTDLFNQLALINSSQTIFASNTSSLSVDDLQRNVPNPERVAGMHFFNPAQIMKLVEVVKAVNTSEQTISALVEVCKKLQKTPVVCKDAPGFIVNRVARHYYLEAMRMVEKGIATMESVDILMEASGFKMGPFKLMDLIGNDINLAVSQSLYDAFNQEPRFQPSELQIEKVRKGDLGKKTGKGFYDYHS
jgi:3-hydroxybutyryl-CoA dehydrogenase